MFNRFTPETRIHYDNAHQDASYLKRLDEYDLNRVQEYAEDYWFSHLRRAEMLFNANPDYAYPEQYRNGHEFDYWLDKEYQTGQTRKVLREIERLQALQQSSQDQSKNPSPDISAIPADDDKTKPLEHVRISLIRIYNKEPISKTNAQSIAESYGHNAPNAGRVLLRKYNPLEDDTTRLKHRDIESHIEAIKKNLTPDGLQRSENDLNKIRNKRY